MKIDLDANITPNFKWREALWLPSWQLHCVPESEQIKSNIIKTCEMLEVVRLELQCPIKINSLLRPKTYNLFVGGSTFSRHKIGLAADVVPVGKDLQKCKIHLASCAAALGFGIENNGLGQWIHVDLSERVKGRFFLP